GVTPIKPDDGTQAGEPVYTTAAFGTCQLDFDAAGNSFVRLWTSNSGVEKVDSSHQAKGSFDGGVLANDISVDRANGSVFVVHPEDVTTYQAGELPLTGTPFAEPKLSGGSGIGVAVNASGGKVYVADAGHGEIHVYALPPARTLTIAKSGTGSGTFQCAV